jgi:hypothetical protein
MIINVLKLLILSFTLMATPLAFGYPSVGDFAEYSGKVEESNKVFHFLQQVELIAVDDKEIFTKQTTTLYDGQNPIVNTTAVSKKDLVSTGYVQQTFSNCNFFGGTLENLKTETLGYILTCRTDSKTISGFRVLWVADIPFGYARTRITSKGDPSVMTLEIKRFHFGTFEQGRKKN